MSLSKVGKRVYIKSIYNKVPRSGPEGGVPEDRRRQSLLNNLEALRRLNSLPTPITVLCSPLIYYAGSVSGCVPVFGLQKCPKKLVRIKTAKDVI